MFRALEVSFDHGGGSGSGSGSGDDRSWVTRPRCSSSSNNQTETRKGSCVCVSLSLIYSYSVAKTQQQQQKTKIRWSESRDWTSIRRLPRLKSRGDREPRTRGGRRGRTSGERAGRARLEMDEGCITVLRYAYIKKDTRGRYGEGDRQDGLQTRTFLRIFGSSSGSARFEVMDIVFFCGL